MPETPPPHERSGDALTAHDWTEGVEAERDASPEAAISNAMVGLKKRFFGKGPQKAQTFIHGRFVFAVLEGGLARSEETLLEAGKDDEVRRNRLLFQETMTKPVTEAVGDITNREVVAYHSQIVFRPDITVEFFVLDEPLER